MKSADNAIFNSDQVYAEQIKLLYKNAPLAYSVTLINGAILVYVQRAYISIFVLLGWYACLLLATVFRIVVVWRYNRISPGPDETRFWHIAYLICVVLVGSVWGATPIVLFPIEAIAHQVFVAFVLAGMGAGGISVLAPRIEVCVAFLLPELLPLAIRYLTLETSLHTAMGTMTLIFLVGMMISAWSFYCAIRTSLNLRFDKQELETEIAQRQHAEVVLFQEKERLQTTLGSIGEGVVLINAEGRIEYLNPAAEQLCGWRSQQAQHQSANEVFKCLDHQDERITPAMEDSLHSATQLKKQCFLFCKAGKKHAIEELATPLYDRYRKMVGVVSVLRDVTEAQQKAEQLIYAADHDALTGLPNRNLLKDRTRQAIARAQRKHENFALLFLDLDRFKEVNDSMGHASGDALLVDVAKRLTSAVREEDTIARLGGDEFVVLLDGPTQEGQIKIVADKILHTLREPFQLGMQSAIVTASIGAGMYPSGGRDAESLLGYADAAMYRAKQQGRNRICM